MYRNRAMQTAMQIGFITRENISWKSGCCCTCSSILVLLIVGVFGTVSATGQASPGSSAKLQPAETAKGRGSPPSKNQPARLYCPSLGGPVIQPLQPSRPGTGHKVTLSWNASAPSPSHPSKAEGYCLYRSRTKNAAKPHHKCDECEQINPVLVAGTRCVDDLVDDGATYYYVAMAINAEGLSDWSNEAMAPIPLGDQTSSAIADSPPLCRKATGHEINTGKAPPGP